LELGAYTVERVGPGGFEEGTVADGVVDYGFAEHGVVFVIIDFDTSASNYFMVLVPIS
jgi:hypothetical protein